MFKNHFNVGNHGNNGTIKLSQLVLSLRKSRNF